VVTDSGHSANDSLADVPGHDKLAPVQNEISWDGDWYGIESATEREWAASELQRELCPEHILFGLEASAIGRRWRRDDLLFRLSDGRLAQVHLTRRSETNPEWPDTQVYATFEDWQAVPVEDR
jgi:hypothetical protein